MLPSVCGTLVLAVPRGLLPIDFRGATPLSALPPVTFLCHDDPFQNRRCLLNTGQTPLLFCMKTIGTRMAYYFGQFLLWPIPTLASSTLAKICQVF